MEELDWTECALIDEPESLWVALHDGGLQRVESDRLAREVRIEVELGFPAPPEPCPERVSLRFEGVTHALLYTYCNWPGPYPARGDAEAQAEYYRKSRAETACLNFLQAQIEDETQFEILSAELHRTETSLTVVLGGTTNDHESASGWQLRIGTASLDVLHLDGSPLGLPELLRLGQAGWDAWGAGAEARRSAAAVPPPGGGDEEQGEEDA